MKKIRLFFAYIFRLLSDLRGMAEAVNTVSSPEELDEYVLGGRK